MIINTTSVLKHIAAFTFATGVSAASVTAQGSPSSEWQGLTVGVNVSQLDVFADLQFTARGLHSQPDGKETGIDLSVEYLAAFAPNILAGVELMYGHNLGAAEDIARYNEFNLIASRWRVDAERSLRLLGKLAVAPSANSLLYVGAGINRVQFSFQETSLLGSNAGTVYTHSDALIGHVIVAGIDQRINDNLSLRVELSHTEINEELYQGGIFDRPTWIDPDMRSFSVGIRYHF